MAITFHAASGSPYAWRVWLALEHKKLPYELRMLSFDKGDLKTPEYLAINPRARVPTLVEDGYAIYESAAIVEYLEHAHPAQPLFPVDVRAGATVRRMIREVDEYVAHPVEHLVEQILFKKEPDRDAAATAKARDALATELARWESTLTGAWLVGSTVTAADHALYPLIGLLQRMESRFGGFALMDQLGPKTRAWMKSVETLPYFDATYPPHWRAAR
jgi:glutathione S-transferase